MESALIPPPPNQISMENGNATAYRVFDISTSRNYLIVDTSGNKIDFGNTTDNPAYNFTGSGLTTFGGNITFPNTAALGTVNNPSAIQYSADGSYVHAGNFSGKTVQWENYNPGSTGVNFISIHESASPASTDVVFQFDYKGMDSIAGLVGYGQDQIIINSTATGNHSSQRQFYVSSGGALMLGMTMAPTLNTIHTGVFVDGSIKIPDGDNIGTVTTPTAIDITGAGVVTFSSFPITPSAAPTTDYQVANKKYVDDQIGTVNSWAEVLALGNTSGGTDVIISAGDSLTVDTNTLVVNASGYADKVGIGTATPSALLDLVGTGGSTSGLSLQNSNEQVLAYFADDAVSSDFNIDYSGTGGVDITLKADGDLILGQQGNVGIGITVPTFPSGGGLHIDAGTTSRIHLTATATGATDTDGSTISVGSDSVLYILQQEAANIAFYNGGSVRMYVDNSGNVNISNLTASQAVFTDGSKNLVSNAITGTGNVVMSASPTLSGTVSIGTMDLASGSITDTSGALDFGDETITFGNNVTMANDTWIGLGSGVADQRVIFDNTNDFILLKGSEVGIYGGSNLFMASGTLHFTANVAESAIQNIANRWFSIAPSDDVTNGGTLTFTSLDAGVGTQVATMHKNSVDLDVVLNVHPTVNNTGITIDDIDNPQITLESTGTDIAAAGTIYFKETGDSGFKIVHNALNSIGDALDITEDDGTQLMRIFRSGRVMIGTDAAADSVLHVVKDQDDTTELRIDNTNSGTDINHVQLGLYDSSTIEAWFAHNNNTDVSEIGADEQLDFNVDGNIAVIINSSQHVTMQPDSDNQGLTIDSTVNGAAGYAPRIHLKANTTSGAVAGSILVTESAVGYGWELRHNASADAFEIYRYAGAGAVLMLDMALSNGYIDIPGVYSETTGSSANVYVASDGSLRRSTSSIKEKTAVRKDVDPGDALLFKPITFESKHDRNRYMGFIAEWMRDINPMYATDGDLPGLQTNAIVAALTATVQKQQKEIDELKKKIK